MTRHPIHHPGAMSVHDLAGPPQIRGKIKLGSEPGPHLFADPSTHGVSTPPKSVRKVRYDEANECLTYATDINSMEFGIDFEDKVSVNQNEVVEEELYTGVVDEAPVYEYTEGGGPTYEYTGEGVYEGERSVEDSEAKDTKQLENQSEDFTTVDIETVCIASLFSLYDMHYMHW